MNFKDLISAFRNDALMGRYDEAVKNGQTLLAQLNTVSVLGGNVEAVRGIIQEQYEKCLVLKSLIHTRRQLKQKSSKKWREKEGVKSGKWQRKEPIGPSMTQSCVPKETFCNAGEEMMEQIEKECILPMRLPGVLKSKGVRTIHSTDVQSVVEYLAANGYRPEKVETLSESQAHAVVVKCSQQQLSETADICRKFNYAVVVVQANAFQIL